MTYYIFDSIVHGLACWKIVDKLRYDAFKGNKRIWDSLTKSYQYE